MKKILVIEDEKDLREDIVDLLTFEGYEVSFAEDGGSGIQAIQEGDPDLVLCDIMMPGMDGFQLKKRLNEEKPQYLTPFIFITALSERSHIRAGMDLGADDYITKPFTIDELRNCIEARLKKANSFEVQIQQQVNAVAQSIASEKLILLDELEKQQEALAELTSANESLIDQIKAKETALTKNALHVIDVNNTIRNIELSLERELLKKSLSISEKKVFQAIKHQLRNKNLFENNLTIFQLKFSQMYPGILHVFSTQYPHLSSLDLTLIAGILVNLTTSQLASMLNILPESIRKSKYRLKQKLDLKAADDLRGFLFEFSGIDRRNG